MGSNAWYYNSDIDDNSDVPTEYIWERLRHRRNQLLAQTDFRMISDSTWNREPWEVYRQALRDLPANVTNPRETIWPNPPII